MLCLDLLLCSTLHFASLLLRHGGVLVCGFFFLVWTEWLQGVANVESGDDAATAHKGKCDEGNEVRAMEVIYKRPSAGRCALAEGMCWW